jgi:hypothetical protein
LKKRISIAIIVWLLATIITFLNFYWVVEEVERIHRTGLLFILFAESFSAGMFVTVELYNKRRASALIRTGTYSFLGVYLFLSVMISIAFMAGLEENFETLIIMEVVVLVITMVILLPIFAAEYFGRKKSLL